jgi:carbamoyl-phosphate synthase large subunit
MGTTKSSKVNVLFTSVGRRLELLRAFRKAYDTLNLDGSIVAFDADPLAPALSIADKVYIVPKVDSPEYIPKLISICRDENVHLVFPLIDPDIFQLVDNREKIESTGAKVVVIPDKSARITHDKLLTHQFFERIGIRNSKYWLPSDIKTINPTFPLFIKNRFGSAAKDTFKLENSRELDFFSTYVPNPIIEEFLPGSEITNDVYCDLHGKVLSVVSRKRLEVRSGEVQKGVTVYDESITRDCVKIAQALEGIGPLTIQCIMKENVPYFTEINARFGGGVPLGIAAGCDMPQWILGQLAGIDFEVPAIGQYKLGLYLSRYDDSIFVPGNTIEKITLNTL